MNHSPKFQTVKEYWDRKVWSEYRVKMAVVKGWITADEYAEITGQPYTV